MAKKYKHKAKRRINIFFTYFLLFLTALFLVIVYYKSRNFKGAKIDELMFYFTTGLVDSNSSSITDAVRDNLFLLVVAFLVVILPIVNSFREKISFEIDFSILGRKKHSAEIVFSEESTRHKLHYALVVFTIATWQLMSAFGVQSYLYALTETSQIYEENYVRPETVQLKFPKKKRNLVYITLESMENTMAQIDNGGQANQPIIPELEKLALTNTSFSNTDKLGGALPAKGTTWTVAGMTAHSAGVPLMDSIRNNMGYFTDFLPGAYTLGQILEKEGYNQTFVMGSKASFGGRDRLLTQHGHYHIYDYDYAQEIKKIDKNYKVWWGYEDKRLFQYAKEEATRLAKSDKPFNLQLLTVDTHFTDGWLDESCETPYENQYSNVYHCSSKQVYDFVNWIKAQSFGDNTTIILTGDHLGMQTSYYRGLIKDETYERTIYNAFINPVVKPVKSKQRLFSSFDMYPTTLAAIGVEIPNNRMGLGVNLFSKEPTLVEKMGGIEELNLELAKKSDFYSNHIFTTMAEDDTNGINELKDINHQKQSL